ncbi:SMP-30/gluconolactonase/LRE family protein [Streptomyces sp. QL37]|uniref:SMP-30/gluconolactonase/LRE family protein n=1 Tax=Streptomyces sp. QL37 TaxID=2093747 RepID=UPI000CF21A6A|nr:SMP-30/gluconolactonase/LRE family protein [Streptomyces sp. QL37]PPQ61307.1 gluconolaconase [Streptomyces sp. QL37]
MTAYDVPEVGPFRPRTEDRLELGEGPRLLADGTLVLVDILAGRLLGAPAEGDRPFEEMARLDVPLGAVAPLDGGVSGAPGRTGWLAAAGTAFVVLDSSGQVVRRVGEPEGAGPGLRMNDAVCDRAGRMWAGTMAYDGTPGAGALHLLDTDGSVRTVLGGLTIPNGPAFSPDGRTMYLADSAVGTVDAFTVGLTDATLSDRRPLFRVDPAVGSPDGMTVDTEGRLWSAIWGAGQIRCYAPDGTLLLAVPVPAVQPSSICLTGEHVVVTTAAVGLEEPGPLDGAVLMARCDATAPAACPASSVFAGQGL